MICAYSHSVRTYQSPTRPRKQAQTSVSGLGIGKYDSLAEANQMSETNFFSTNLAAERCSTNSNVCTEELDCNDICGGSSVEDTCGVCEGNGSTCNISYSTTIQPIFNNNCTGCHGSSGALSLDSWGDLMAGTSNNGPVVISENGIEIITASLLSISSSSR